ncbi:MAG: biotin/lipoyl-binding protein [Gemmatimonadetes bacterium]|nr:biotin/lipoyl-binding protein [Gemmatimonadota bacterium]NIR78247.1 biotin/lipoyl-binding protein [Gemmatimonadota bacterium]NIT86256.1 biotin/lipoyl-binding protein [Gemmatimonadota bacterium]NIU33296.1 biotin/lipoyl-binding protein [Gemmatimonadota bacterium]NIU37590.1 biotin/lipoyl-binding protein [Gemmatimonadota bacterium]
MKARARGWVWITALTSVTVLTAGGWWIYDAYGRGSGPGGIVAASGRVEVPRVRLSSPVGGRVAAITVREGDRVKEGDPVVRFDSRELEASLRGARAEAEAARANVQALGRRLQALERELDLARTEAGRYRRLAESGAAPRRAADRAETALERLEEEVEAARRSREAAVRGVDAAESRVTALEARLDDTMVMAPASGRIETELVRRGEVAGPGQPLFELLREVEAKVVVYLPLVRAERTAPGTEARVWLDALPDRPLSGVVSRVSGEAEFTPKDVHMPDERATLVFAVEVRVEDPGGILKDGFPADVQLRLDSNTPWPEEPPW